MSTSTDAVTPPAGTGAATEPARTDAATAPSRADAANPHPRTDVPIATSRTDAAPLLTGVATAPLRTNAATAPSRPNAATPPSRAWRLALEHIESLLLNGGLRPGDHLPPERRLATDLGVARSSVREAIRVLEVLGLVRTATGSGPTAGAIIVASPDGGMSAVMRLHVAAQGFPVEDIVEARLVVEPAIAAHLARMRDEEGGGGRAAQLSQASALLDAMDVPELEPAEFLALDARFHVSLAEASGNTVLSATMAGLRDSIESYVLQAVPNLPSWWATSARLRSEHRGILQAIESGDGTDAAQRVHTHVAGYYKELRQAEGERARPARSPIATSSA